MQKNNGKPEKNLMLMLPLFMKDSPIKNETALCIQALGYSFGNTKKSRKIKQPQ
jgi:hypothetical protein